MLVSIMMPLPLISIFLFHFSSKFMPAAAYSCSSSTLPFNSKWVGKTATTTLHANPISQSTSTLSFRMVEWFQNLFTNILPSPSHHNSESISDSPFLPSFQPHDAVLIFGGTGRAGAEIVNSLRCRGKQVVLATRRNSSEAAAVLAQFDADNGDKSLLVRTGIDVTDATTLTSKLFEGIATVISCVGPSQKDSKLTAENVDYKGNLALIEATKKNVRYSISNTYKNIYDFDVSNRNLSQWVNLDDVIMGGKSKSKWSLVDWKGEGSSFARWNGVVITEGGGFCGTVCTYNDFEVDPNQFDGVYIRVRGDGSRYKLRLRSKTLESNVIYQAPFDTINGVWIDVKIPFDYFYNNKQTIINYSASGTIMAQGVQTYDIGFVYSKFDFNERRNSKFLSEKFTIDVEYLKLYREPRPVFVLVSSAGSERVNRLSSEERSKDIPIVMLNPQGILNWKYKSEQYLRESSLPYSIIRASGIIPFSAVNNTRKVEFSQCDQFSGRITRQELANVVTTVVETSSSTGKTFEVRRDESDSGLLGNIRSNWGDKQTNIDQLMRRLISDSDRTVNGLLPFPLAQDPPPPLTEEQTKAILNDPRVVAVSQRDAEVKQIALPKY